MSIKNKWTWVEFRLTATMSTFSSITTSNAYYNVYFQSLKYTIPITTQSCFKRRKRSSSIVSSSNEMMNKSMDELLVVSTISRRQVVNVLILTGFLLWDSLERFGMAMSEVLELERYTDSVQGFTLLRPSSWNKVHLIPHLSLSLFFGKITQIYNFNLSYLHEFPIFLTNYVSLFDVPKS